MTSPATPPAHVHADLPRGVFLPWATLLATGAVLGMVLLHWQQGSFVFQATKLGPSVPKDPQSWWRLVAALFVHGKDQVLPCVMTVSLVLGYGLRTERALGAGAVLAILALGGGLGNLTRCLVEEPTWLEVSGGGVPAGVALAAAAAAAAIRMREAPFVRAVLGAVFSTAFAIFLAASPQSGVGMDQTMGGMIPGMLVAFVVGGFLAAVLPLRATAGRATTLVLLLVGLALVGVPAVVYARKVVPVIRGKAAPPPPQDPSLKTETNARLELSFGIPITFRERELARKPEQPTALYAPFFSDRPRLVIQTAKRGPSPDTVVTGVGRELAKADREGVILKEGPFEAPIGPGYIMGFKYTRQNESLQQWTFAFDAGNRTVLLLLEASADDPDAPAMAQAIARSLKRPERSSDKD